MRRYDIVSGILLILSITDFALAAPVLVQEKRQTSVDVVHIPRDVITVLGRRGSEGGLEKLIEELSGTWEKPVESSDAHASASSSSALPVPDHGSTNDAEAPALNSASSPANPDPLMGPSSPSLLAHSDPLSESGSDDEWPIYSPTWTGYSSDLTGEHVPIDSPTSTEYGSDLREEHVPPPNTNPGSSTGSNPDLDGDNWANLEDQSSLKRPKLESSEKFGQADDDQVVHAQQPNPGLLPDLKA
jgi:hypothetical protein